MMLRVIAILALFVCRASLESIAAEAPKPASEPEKGPDHDQTKRFHLSSPQDGFLPPPFIFDSLPSKPFSEPPPPPPPKITIIPLNSPADDAEYYEDDDPPSSVITVTVMPLLNKLSPLPPPKINNFLPPPPPPPPFPFLFPPQDLLFETSKINGNDAEDDEILAKLPKLKLSNDINNFRSKLFPLNSDNDFLTGGAPELIQDASTIFRDEFDEPFFKGLPPPPPLPRFPHPIFHEFSVKDKDNDYLDYGEDSLKIGTTTIRTTTTAKPAPKSDQPECFTIPEVYRGTKSMVQGFGKGKTWKDSFGEVGRSMEKAAVSVKDCAHRVWKDFTHFLGFKKREVPQHDGILFAQAVPEEFEDKESPKRSDLEEREEESFEGGGNAWTKTKRLVRGARSMVADAGDKVMSWVSKRSVQNQNQIIA